MATATHVFVHDEARENKLQPTYRGPYRVLERTDKYFTLDVNGKSDNDSIDHIKPAILSNLYVHFMSRDYDKKFQVTRTGRLSVRPSRYDN